MEMTELLMPTIFGLDREALLLVTLKPTLVNSPLTFMETDSLLL